MRISDWSSDVCSSDLELPVARFPDIAFPMTTITITQPGASPSQLEAEVTRRVEDSVATIPNIKRVMSNVSEGVSVTSIEFRLEADLATALDDTRDAVTRLRTDLPQDIRSEEHTSELQSLMRNSYAVFCLTKKI